MADYISFNVSFTEEVRKTDFPLLPSVAPYIYAFLTVTGLIGNSLVLAVVSKTFCSKQVNHVYVYLFALCFMDVMAFLTGPITISHMIVGSWIFDQSTCKFMYLCEGLHKSGSVYFLIGLTGDRYLAICHPFSSQCRRTLKSATIYVALSCLSVIFANIPLFIYSDISDIRLNPNSSATSVCSLDFPSLQTRNSTRVFEEQIEDNTVVVYYDADIDEQLDSQNISAWHSTGTYYFLFMFTFFHLIPGVLILLFTIKIFSRLQHRLRANQQSRVTHIHKRRVVTATVAVVLMYFCCWTPFWSLQMFIRIWGVSVAESDRLVTVATVVYSLPYFNSNLNALLYASLHRSLKKASSRRCTKIATNQV